MIHISTIETSREGDISIPITRRVVLIKLRVSLLDGFYIICLPFPERGLLRFYEFLEGFLHQICGHIQDVVLLGFNN